MARISAGRPIETVLLSEHMTGWTSPTHIILLLLIALLLFGAKRLPEIGRSLGTGMREFKDSVTGNNPPENPPAQIAPPETTTTTATQSERETI
jgi:sec-independent protein translocase protein TatA